MVFRALTGAATDGTAGRGAVNSALEGEACLSLSVADILVKRAWNVPADRYGRGAHGLTRPHL